MLTRSYGSFHTKNRKDRVTKLQKLPKKSFHETLKQKLTQTLEIHNLLVGESVASPKLVSPIITIEVGHQARLFAAHEDVLSTSPFFTTALAKQFLAAMDSNERRLSLLDEDPEVFSCVLEYLYKGDYSPSLIHNKSHDTWGLEGQETSDSHIGRGREEFATLPCPTIFHSVSGSVILRDTAIYCAAHKYGLNDLKRISLKKQGLQSKIEVSVILQSARYAYDNTPDSDSRLRAHYLALIVRSRRTFKRSGTMQMEMDLGGKLFFDLFVAMCNHIDDIEQLTLKGTPRTI